MPGKYITFTDAIYDYTVAQRSNANDPLLEELRKETQALGEISRMSIGFDQATFMGVLVASIGTKLAVEIGTFTGTSSIAIARHLAPGGKLVCFDADENFTNIAKKFWAKAKVADRIELRLGDGHKLLPQFKPSGPVDFVFIDADKEGYDLYYETILPHVRPNGLILFDNMLRDGALADPARLNTPDNKALDALNRKLAADARVQSVLLSIGDGVMMCRKL